MLLAEINSGLIDTGVTAVGDDGFGVLGLTLGVPHLSRIADHGWHGSINDDVTGHMQVGDALV